MEEERGNKLETLMPHRGEMENVKNTVGWLTKLFLACLCYNTIKVKNFFTYALLKLPLQKAMNHKQESASFFWE